MTLPTLSRRRFIRVLGGGGVIVAASAIGLNRCDRMPAEAIAPWQKPAVAETDPRRIALSYALLAPNSHNLQPWLVNLAEADAITLSVDPARLLPQTDPFNRQIVISHGTFLELLRLGALEQGFRTDIQYFPEGPYTDAQIDQRPLAQIKFIRDSTVSRDSLFQHIVQRRSNKEPYGADPIRPSHAEALAEAIEDTETRVEIVAEATTVSRLRELSADAMALEMAIPRTLRESIDVLRVGAAEIAQHRDGIDLHGPLFWWLKQLGLMTADKAMTPGTLAYQGGIDYALGWAHATPSFGWLSTPDNTRLSQVQAGQAYLRLNLKATGLGVAMHPISQLLQEYPEMQELQNQFLALVQPAPGEQVQMLFRLGYAPRPAPSPRRALDDLIL